MPAHATVDHDPREWRPTARPACPEPAETTTTAAVPRVLPGDQAGIEERIVAANQRAAELEEQLAAAVAARDAAEHRAAQLQDRNRELSCDLDNALDELAGHAGHAEQERLVHVPVWSPWSASADREGYDR